MNARIRPDHFSTPDLRTEDDFSLHGAWLMMPVLYYIGLWRAKSRYQ